MNDDRAFELNTLVAQVAPQRAVQTGERYMVERRTSALANPVNALHGYARGRKLAPRCYLPRERRFGTRHKGQRNGILGEFDAFQKQHRGQSADAQQPSAGTTCVDPHRLHHFLAAFFALRSVAAVLERPHRCEREIIGRVRHAFGGPSRHGDAIGVGMVHFLVQRESSAGKTVDHVYFPKRTGAVEQRRVQFGDKIVERLLVVFSLGQLVIKNVLIEVHCINVLPVRHRGRCKNDDAIERRPDIGKREKFAEQVFRKADG